MPYIGVSPQFGVRRKHTYTATAGQTSFSGAGAEGATLSYKDSNFVDVYQNGVKLGDADYTSTSGTAIVLAQGASVDDLVEIIVFDAFSAADTVSKADGGQFDGNVTMGGTLGVTGATTLTGDLSVDTNVLKVDTTNNRVGFNITSPSNKVHTHQTTSGGNFIQITNSTTGTTSGDGFIVGIDSGENANLWNYENEDMVFATNNTERLRLTSDGKLGIATSSPSSTVEIAGALAVGSGCTASGTAGSMAVGHASSATGARSFVFGREMTVSGDHSFGIALSDQNGLDLTANNTMAVVGGTVLINRSSSNTVTSTALDIDADQHVFGIVITANGTNGAFVRLLANDGTTVGSIDHSGSNARYLTSSDYRLKENIVDMTDATTRIKKLKPRRFNFIADETNTTVDGFLAHEVSHDADGNPLVPEAVNGDKDAIDADGNIDPQGIDQSKLVPLLVKTIQELEARISALEGA